MDDLLYTDISGNFNEFIATNKGWFSPVDIRREYDIASDEGKTILRELLKEALEGKVLEHEGLKYRVVDTDCREIDWFNADEKQYIELNLPFRLHEYLKLFAGVVVITGEKGKGKTAFMYDTIFRNINPERPQHLFASDNIEVEIRERFLSILEDKNMALPGPELLRVWERHSNFADVIVRDGINYIDYLDVNTDFYSIGQEIDDIHRATGNGITFIGLQKNPKEKLGVGGIYSWKKSQVYIVLAEPGDSAIAEQWQGELILKRTRGRVDKLMDPTGWKRYYYIQEGFKFIAEANWRR